MKITNAIVKQFESDQKSYGTKIALQNIIWQLASSLLKNIGVTSIKTSYGKQRISKKAASAILADSSRKASVSAKRASPRLKRVKG